MARNYIATIGDMERYYYSTAGANYIAKADAPVLTTTSGVYNAIYGAQVWSQLNQEANAFGVLPKYAWSKSGWRVESVRAAASGGGVAENGAIPDTTKPTFVEVSTKQKSVAHPFDVSEVQQFEASISEDDSFGAMEQMRPLMGQHHAEMMNIMLLSDADTVAGNNLESIDRVIANNSEVAIVDANDLDIYGLDRDAGATWADAYVSHNSGTDRDLTDQLIRTTIQNLAENGGNTTMIMTGHDVSKSALPGLYDEQVRYNPFETGAKVKVSVNGIETGTGIDFGVPISTLYGLPVISSKNTVKDTISRMYFMDTSDPEGYGEPRLGLKIAKPTQYFEAGIDATSPDPFGINRLGTEGMYRTMGELICKFFGAQGKIRDLK